MISFFKRVLFLGVCSALSGCSSLGYVWQAATGHLSILANSEDIEKVINRPTTSAKLVKQLEQVQTIRQFSVEVLALPDNRSYRVYTQIEGKYPVWNVVAAPVDGLKLKTWCFLAVGCISYKGFYEEADARAYGQALRDQGLDVAVSGVLAYSTLGFTNDPILSSFVFLPVGELARLIFHELAHQVVYIENDSQFNESFATAVEELGVQAWLGQVGMENVKQEYEAFDAKRVVFKRLIVDARLELAKAYEEHAQDRRARLREKERIISQLENRYEAVKNNLWNGWGGYDNYFKNNLNNAKLALASVYNSHVPGFKALFTRCGADFALFYKAVEVLGEFEREQRDELLRVLAERQLMPVSLGCDLEVTASR